ncbi:FoF1 ATP synthase subunit delta/epsilon [Spiroplasma apis]|uniref:F0F1 ATP synthase subunit epsilon n=1 Tax=Spiroplasma apis B31 TaxID=1276258 RepID=V5RGV9_SPIAP|nr:F0F1 ATP synthase subunit epsilon [Spiroplasma apis]AHB35902.1 F0F1 ATP synthase subunit epsilon [Spiroplasma apis B31]
MKLKVITPDGIFLNDIEVNYVGVQTSAGDMTIYSRHIPIVSTLIIGVLKYEHENIKKYIHVHRGILQVSKEQVKILTQRLYEVDENGKRISENTYE